MQEGKAKRPETAAARDRDTASPTSCAARTQEWVSAGRRRVHAQSEAGCPSQDKLAEKKMLLLQAVQR